MNPTSRETRAARNLADAIVEFILATSDASSGRFASRMAERLRAAEESKHHREPVQDSLKRILTIKEAAEVLGISDRTLWKMSKPRGPIPVVRMGKRNGYDMDDLNKAIDDMKCVAT